MARNLIVAGTSSTVFHGATIGPFVDGNNNVYAFIKDTTNEALDAYKTSDPSGGSWTAQDTSSNPDVASHTLDRWSCFQDGDTIHIVIAWMETNQVDYRYYTYHLSSHSTNPDTWQVDELIETPLNSPVVASVDQPGCDIVVRSNGDVVVFYNGDMDKVMGVDYTRVDYAKRTGVATWSAGNSIDDEAGEVGYLTVRCGLAESDRVWFDFTDITASDLMQESINNSDTEEGLADVETAAYASAGSDWVQKFSNIEYYDDGGTAVICRAYQENSSNNLYARYVRGTTLQTRAQIATDQGSDAHPSLAVKNKTVYCVYKEFGGDIVYRANDDEGGWDASNTEIHAPTSGGTSGLHARKINYGGDDYLAVIYYDNDATAGPSYTEISIGAPPTPVGHAGRMTLLGVQ